MSLAKASTGFGRTSMACQCTSIKPGISVWPRPSIVVTLAMLSIEIGPVEILSILSPRTSTLEGAESEPLLPSNMRTFWNRTVDCGAGGPGSASALSGR